MGLAMSLTKNKIDWNRFALDLRSFRTSHNITCRHMSRLTGVNFNVISRVELGKIHCSADAFVTLALEIEKNPLDYVTTNSE